MTLVSEIVDDNRTTEWTFQMELLDRRQNINAQNQRMKKGDEYKKSKSQWTRLARFVFHIV